MRCPAPPTVALPESAAPDSSPDDFSQKVADSLIFDVRLAEKSAVRKSEKRKLARYTKVVQNQYYIQYIKDLDQWGKELLLYIILHKAPDKHDICLSYDRVNDWFKGKPTSHTQAIRALKAIHIIEKSEGRGMYRVNWALLPTGWGLQ
jgi:hypothetical protein